MKDFKVLVVSFISAVLVFSSTGLKANNLLPTVLDFYYLENQEDEDVVLVYACSIPVGIENISIDENQSNLDLHCPTILEVAASDLDQFASKLNEELYIEPGKAILGTLGIVGSVASGFYGTVNFFVRFPEISKKASITTMVISSVVLFGSIAWLRSDYGNIVPAYRKHLAGQIHAGIIKGENVNSHNLKLFTDFLNQSGRLHDNN